MKSYYIFVLIFFLSACHKTEEEPEYTAIPIEKSYPYVSEKCSIEDTDRVKFELFNQNIFLIHSMDQLTESHLFKYCPEALQKELTACNFEYHTLVLAASSSLNKIYDLKHTALFDNYFSDYQYVQTLYMHEYKETIEYMYFILNAFVIKKIRKIQT